MEKYFPVHMYYRLQSTLINSPLVNNTITMCIYGQDMDTIVTNYSCCIVYNSPIRLGTKRKMFSPMLAMASFNKLLVVL